MAHRVLLVKVQPYPQPLEFHAPHDNTDTSQR